MKKLKLFACFSLFIFHFSFSYGQSWLWAKGGFGSIKTNDFASPVAVDNNYNAYITGQYETTVIFGNDTLSCKTENAYLTKYNPVGNVIWARQIIDTGGYSYGTSVATDNQGNVYITGLYSGNAQAGSFSLSGSLSGYNIYIIKYDTNGNVLWAKQSIFPTGSGYHQNFAYSVTSDQNGNTFITGYFTDTITFGTYTLINKALYARPTIFTVKYDPNGNVLWAAEPQNTFNYGYAYGLSAATDNSGNSYVTGYFYDSLAFGSNTLISNTEPSGFLVKYDPNGNVLWSTQAFNRSISSNCSPNSVITDQAGNAYITGSFYDIVKFGSKELYSPSTSSVFLVKYDANGSVLWARQSSGGWEGTGLASANINNYIFMSGLANNGNPDSLIFGGYAIPTNPWQNYASFVMKFDTSGDPLCGSIINNLGYYSLNGVACDARGYYVYTASTFQDSVFYGNDTLLNHGGGDNTFVSRWLPCDVYLGVNEVKPKNENLTVYPNPFTNTTTIALTTQYSLPTTDYLELDDLTGRKLRWIEFTGTQYELQAQDLAKGLYFIRAFDSDMNVIGTSKIVVQ